MQRDMELFRQLLFEIEKFPFDGKIRRIAIDGYTEQQISYHIMLLHQAGFIQAFDTSNNDGMFWNAKWLNNSGHEFLDSIKNDTVWEKSKSLVVKNVGALSLEALKLAVPAVIKTMFPH